MPSNEALPHAAGACLPSATLPWLSSLSQYPVYFSYSEAIICWKTLTFNPCPFHAAWHCHSPFDDIVQFFLQDFLKVTPTGLSGPTLFLPSFSKCFQCLSPIVFIDPYPPWLLGQAFVYLFSIIHSHSSESAFQIIGTQYMLKWT